MKKYLMSLALLFVFVLAFNGVVFGWGTQGGDGSNYRQLQETAVFLNNSGQILSAGNVVILDTAGTDASSGTTLGAGITIAETAPMDSVLAVGVVHEFQTSVLSGTPVVIVTKGPVKTLIADSTDAVTINTAVGTTAYVKDCAACAGGGTNLGIALEAGDGTDGDEIIVWVSPTGAD